MCTKSYFEYVQFAPNIICSNVSIAPRYEIDFRQFHQTVFASKSCIVYFILFDVQMLLGILKSSCENVKLGK